VSGREHATQLSPPGATITFTATPLEEYDEGDFDVIVSNQTFEHVMDLGTVLAAMRQRLRPGGRAYVGFGLLYHSPFGHHGWTGTRLPWGHVVVSERVLVARVNRRGARPIRSIRDLGLNMLRLSDYRRLIAGSGLRVISFRVNQNTHPLSRVFSLGRFVPPLADYFTHNVYCILEKPTRRTMA